MKKELANFFRSTLTILSPYLNTEVTYYVKNKKRINLKNPKSFSEKLLKLRLENYNNNKDVKRLADKYLVRGYIEKKGYPEILNELLYIYDSPDDIEWEKLPNSFVIKLNYGSGYNIIVKDRNKMNFDNIKSKLKKWLKERPWLWYAEMQYKNVVPKIIVEKYLEMDSGSVIPDYKEYCFNNKAKAILYIGGRNTADIGAGFFDRKWHYLGINKKKYNNLENNLPSKPYNLEKMLNISEDLSKGFPFVRVDFYEVNNKLIFGEMTFTPAAGFYASEIEINGQSMGEILEI